MDRIGNNGEGKAYYFDLRGYPPRAPLGIVGDMTAASRYGKFCRLCKVAKVVQKRWALCDLSGMTSGPDREGLLF